METIKINLVESESHHPDNVTGFIESENNVSDDGQGFWTDGKGARFSKRFFSKREAGRLSLGSV